MRNGIFNLFFSERLFEEFAGQLAEESDRQPEVDTDAVLNKYRSQARAAAYLLVIGISLLCFVQNGWLVALALVLIGVYGIDLPWTVRVVMLLRRARELRGAA